MKAVLAHEATRPRLVVGEDTSKWNKETDAINGEGQHLKADISLWERFNLSLEKHGRRNPVAEVQLNLVARFCRASPTPVSRPRPPLNHFCSCRRPSAARGPRPIPSAPCGGPWPGPGSTSSRWRRWWGWACSQTRWWRSRRGTCGGNCGSLPLQEERKQSVGHVVACHGPDTSKPCVFSISRSLALLGTR